MARFFREDFDRDKEFVVTRPFTFSGQGLVPGQSINKRDFTVRRLRQLYDMRNIGFAEVSEGAQALLQYGKEYQDDKGMQLGNEGQPDDPPPNPPVEGKPEAPKPTTEAEQQPEKRPGSTPRRRARPSPD